MRPILRLIDASANRALEGLRVCEEWSRFVLEDARLTRELRALRHGIVQALRRLPVAAEELVAARESARDLGRAFRPTIRRVRPADLLRANLQRAKEALRTLEESAQLIHPSSAAAFQRLRFRTYDLEQTLLRRVAAVRHHRPRRAGRTGSCHRR